MPPKTEEITAVFLRERFRREDFVIAEVRPVNGSRDADSLFSSGLSVKGTAEVGELEPGLEYRFYGHREKHPKYGVSFAFRTFILSEPHERRGVIAYLQKAPHIGPITAEAFWRKFKSQAVRVLRETPEVAAAAVPQLARMIVRKRKLLKTFPSDSRKQDYSRYLRSGDWLVQREKAWMRAEWKCEGCHADYDEKTATVHHKTYERFGSELPEDLMALCWSCHNAIDHENTYVEMSCLAAEEAAAELRRLAATEDATIDLIGLLSGRGFPKATAKEAIRAWGNRAAKLVERNPYLLMAFRGCGFLKTDAMYLDLGLPPARLKRQALCAWHAIATDSEGHTWYPVEMLAEAIRQKVAGASVNPVRACRLAKRAGMIAFRKDVGGRIWAADGKKARAEEYVARAVAMAIRQG